MRPVYFAMRIICYSIYVRVEHAYKGERVRNLWSEIVFKFLWELQAAM